MDRTRRYWHELGCCLEPPSFHIYMYLKLPCLAYNFFVMEVRIRTPTDVHCSVFSLSTFEDQTEIGEIEARWVYRGLQLSFHMRISLEILHL